MTQTPTMEQERPVTLREQELLRLGDSLATKFAQRDRMVEDKAAENKRRQGDIDTLTGEMSKIAELIREKRENRAQGDLFVDQVVEGESGVPPAAAAQRLAEIAAWSAKHPFVADAEKIDTCAAEGCGKQQGDDVHVPPAPSAPHKFVGDGSGEDRCWGCGSGSGDEIHAEPKAVEAAPEPEPAPARDPNAPHAADLGEGQPEDQPKACVFCSRAADDPIHETAIAETVDCSRCGKHVPKAEVLYDGEVKPVCDPCVRGGIEAGTWPHVFEAKEGVTPGTRTKCRHCKRRSDDAVHVQRTEDTVEESRILHGDPTQPGPAGVIDASASTGDPAYDFTESDPPPVIDGTQTIEKPQDGADDGKVGGEAGA